MTIMMMIESIVKFEVHSGNIMTDKHNLTQTQNLSTSVWCVQRDGAAHPTCDGNQGDYYKWTTNYLFTST